MDPPDTPPQLEGEQTDLSGSEMEASVKTNRKRKQRLSDRQSTNDDEKGEPSKTKDNGRRVACPLCGKQVDKYKLDNHMISRNCRKDETPVADQVSKI